MRWGVLQQKGECGWRVQKCRARAQGRHIDGAGGDGAGGEGAGGDGAGGDGASGGLGLCSESLIPSFTQSQTFQFLPLLSRNRSQRDLQLSVGCIPVLGYIYMR
jgi:hypothetical protein